jgi:hypothetical protein
LKASRKLAECFMKRPREQCCDGERNRTDAMGCSGGTRWRQGRRVMHVIWVIALFGWRAASEGSRRRTNSALDTG